MKQLNQGIYLADSGNPGNTTTIMVGVHGDEKAGPLALDEIMKNIKITKGKVYFIYANLKALEENKRFTEINMNRVFSENNKGNTYEETRVKDILPFLKESKYVLDMHNTTNPLNSIPFFIGEHSEFGKYFPVKYVTSGFNDIHPGGSDNYVDLQGNVGICIESGSIYDSDNVEIARNSILNFLKITENIEGTPAVYENEARIKFDFIYKNKTNKFKLTKEFEDFEKVKKGIVLAYDDQEEIKMPRDGYILFPEEPDQIGGECFVLGKK